MYVQGFSVEMRPSLSSVIRFPAKRRALSRHFIPNMYLEEMEEMGEMEEMEEMGEGRATER
jgi:hypothetical protein